MLAIQPAAHVRSLRRGLVFAAGALAAILALVGATSASPRCAASAPAGAAPWGALAPIEAQR